MNEVVLPASSRMYVLDSSLTNVKTGLNVTLLPFSDRVSDLPQGDNGGWFITRRVWSYCTYMYVCMYLHMYLLHVALPRQTCFLAFCEKKKEEWA